MTSGDDFRLHADYFKQSGNRLCMGGIRFPSVFSDLGAMRLNGKSICPFDHVGHFDPLLLGTEGRVDV